jgi:site-specific DNA-methyltransferase (adenine-specific)
MIHLFNEDNMIGMARYPDGFFELAIVDPPYGIGESMKKRENNRTDKWKNPYKKEHSPKLWDKFSPPAEYFPELRRVSNNQIIWGGNFFLDYLPSTPCMVVWDKCNGNTDFSDCEIAWSSFDTAVRKFRWLWNGFQKQKPEIRIHPTQKPVALYKWLLKNYAKPGDKILDTHGGSMSSAIACHDMGYDCWIWELDEEYFNAGKARLERHMMQQRLF